jgi:RimJ/RimL family protein N-acetyltransferase
VSDVDPLLVEVPERLETARLVLRAARAGDGEAVRAAVLDTFEALRPWMPWARHEPTVDAQESYCRRQQALFTLREELTWFVYERGSDGPAGPVLGAVGLHHIDWKLRRFELGWWRRSGLEHLGIAAEAAGSVLRLVFDRLGGRRLEVRMDDTNAASRRLAERLGFTDEGLLRLDSATPGGEPRSTRIYARVRGVEEAPSGETGPGG